MFRPLLILIVYLAILWRVILPVFKVLLPILDRTGHENALNLWLPTLLISPPLLAMLVLFIERAGPVKNWAVSFLLFLFYPALALNHDCAALLEFVREGRLPSFWATLLLNATVFAYALAYADRLIPRACPGCQRRTLIRLMRLFQKDKRTSNTCWCASCGGKYWKDQEGNWRVERRTTWLDGRTEPTTLRGMKAMRGGHPEGAETTDRSLGQRVATDIHSS